MSFKIKTKFNRKETGSILFCQIDQWMTIMDFQTNKTSNTGSAPINCSKKDTVRLIIQNETEKGFRKIYSLPLYTDFHFVASETW